MDQFKVKFTHLIIDKGKDKWLRETVLFEECINFTDAETQAYELEDQRGLREFEVESITRTSYDKIVKDDDLLENSDIAAWFEASVTEEIELDNGKVQKVKVKHLIFKESVSDVENIIDNQIYVDSIVPYRTDSVKDSKILEVIKNK